MFKRQPQISQEVEAKLTLLRKELNEFLENKGVRIKINVLSNGTMLKIFCISIR